MPPVVIIGRFRYINAKIMSAGHDWAEKNSDLRGLKGLIKVDTFHIAPDRGMAVFYLRTGEHAKLPFHNWKIHLLNIPKCLTVR